MEHERHQFPNEYTEPYIHNERKILMRFTYVVAADGRHDLVDRIFLREEWARAPTDQEKSGAYDGRDLRPGQRRTNFQRVPEELGTLSEPPPDSLPVQSPPPKGRNPEPPMAQPPEPATPQPVTTAPVHQLPIKAPPPGITWVEPKAQQIATPPVTVQQQTALPMPASPPVPAAPADVRMHAQQQPSQPTPLTIPAPPHASRFTQQQLWGNVIRGTNAAPNVLNPKPPPPPPPQAGRPGSPAASSSGSETLWCVNRVWIVNPQAASPKSQRAASPGAWPGGNFQ